MSFAYFIVYTVFPYIYFVVLVNSDEEEEFRSVSKYLIFLILLQIPVSLLKYALLGQSEHGLIGTISTKAGSLSTIFPLFAISFLFAKYLFESRKIYILLIGGYVLMGIIGEKLAIGLYTPLIIVLIYIIYKFKEGTLISNNTLTNLLVVALLGLVSFYFTVRLNPHINPDKKIWGRFNLDYVMSYSYRYVNKAPNKQELQRVAALQYFTNYLVKRGGTELLVGEGAGKLVESKLKSEKGSMLKQYGVRYGGRTSFIWLWLRTGLLGRGDLSHISFGYDVLLVQAL